MRSIDAAVKMESTALWHLGAVDRLWYTLTCCPISWDHVWTAPSVQGENRRRRAVAWLGHHERFTFHFVPTSCSWLNAVEGFFAKLSKRRLRRGVFHSIVDLQAAINRFVDETNQTPKPFTWTADPDKIIAAVKRGYQVLDSIH